MTPKLNENGRAVLAGVELDTKQVEKLLHDLAEVRNLMTPAVAGSIGELDEDARIVFQEDPSIMVGRNEDRRITLGLRHQGFGWCVFALSDSAAAHIRNALAKRLAGKLVEVMDEEGPDGGTPKH